MGLIRELGGELGVPLPATTLHRQLLAEGVAQGWGDADNPAIIAVLRAMADRRREA